MLVDHLFWYRISPWPKTAEKRGFCTGVRDRPTDRPTDRPSSRDAFLTDASKNAKKYERKTQLTDKRKSEGGFKRERPIKNPKRKRERENHE